MDFLPFTRPEIDEATIAEVADVLRSGWITSGPRVKAFEAALSEFCRHRPVRVVSSATAALEIALRIAGVGPGDEVITTPLTWVATANVILEVGATPRFVDIDPETRNIDLARVEAAINPKTRAILPVDLAGLPVDREQLYEIANRHRLRVIEDAAQSLGSVSHGKRLGSFGDLVAFSFHANKNITSTEGGCLVMNNEEEAILFEKLRLQGVVRFPDGTMDVDVLGGKSNLTDVAAAVGLGQLPHLERFNARRRSLAQRYFERIDPACALTLPPADFTESNWHMFQPLLPLGQMTISRGEFIAGMRKLGIGIGVHYPALHLFTLYRQMGYQRGDFPFAEDIGDRTITLPLFPAMQDSDIDRVVAALQAVLIPSLTGQA